MTAAPADAVEGLPTLSIGARVQTELRTPRPPLVTTLETSP